MKIDGKGVVIVNANGTYNYFTYHDEKELKEMIDRFTKGQHLSDITVVDIEDKELIFFEDFNERFGGDYNEGI